MLKNDKVMKKRKDESWTKGIRSLAGIGGQVKFEIEWVR